MKNLPIGLYDLLHTKELQARLSDSGLLNQAEWGKIDPSQLTNYLAIPLAREIARFIGETLTKKNEAEWASCLSQALSSSDKLIPILDALKPLRGEALREIKPNIPEYKKTPHPDTGLAVSALLTGSSRSPALRSQLIKELQGCDSADWLVSFIKFAGILPLLPTLREFTTTPTPDGGPRLRIATTSYMGATDLKAIKTLLELPNTEIKVSYDTKRTRLHAKAYLFHRKTGFSSAYIGSANVSKAALDEGLEWTAKISQYETEHLWQHAIATFDSHWEDSHEFTICSIGDLPRLEQALQIERGSPLDESTSTFFNLAPFAHQEIILEDIHAEREAGKNKHLIVAATGTGKTMVAGFDYKNFAKQNNKQPTLLFIAHREEILKQARAAFRQILKDGSFGDIVVGGNQITQNNHLFCTVQSWNSRNFSHFDPSHFEYVVLDEAHHASARSYQQLIDHIRPASLLGLTATPERMDGKDIRDDFDGAFTHEIRLPEAVDRALLCPFHYYGIPDVEGLDFSSISWQRGRYDALELAEKISTNKNRAEWVMGQTEKYVADLQSIRGLGFCVNIDHANYMAEFCNQNNIPSIALTSESSQNERDTAQRQLTQRTLRFIFTVDLYNEGVDIPCVDTVLFLRPTESLTVFLQQLGRGLRLSDEKSHLTVLDFIAPQHKNFSYAKRFQALSSHPTTRIDRQIENGMPFLPSGALIHLERQAKEYVLENIRNATANLRGQRLIGELRQLHQHLPAGVRLQDMLNHLHLDHPDEIYKKGIPHQLMSEVIQQPLNEDEMLFSDDLKNGFRRLALMDDTRLITDAKRLVTSGQAQDRFTQTWLNSVLWNENRPGDGTLEQAHLFIASRKGIQKDLIELFDWLLGQQTPLPTLRLDISGPLTLHASYTRKQILMAFGQGDFSTPRSSREGLLHIPDQKIDLFFADINKTEADYSPTTMYEDYAINEHLFHWQSQSTASEDSATGQRYIHHKEQGYTPILFIRDRKQTATGLTTPYFYAGPLTYQSHQGSRPMTIRWELQVPLPAKALAWAKMVA
jgi:superfamily II DNA or RNA helicase/HKD family nuclease